MRGIDVATGDCVRLAATVSLVLAAAKVRDHVDDGDGVAGTAGIRPAARRIARRWARQGAETGAVVGFDTAVLLEAVDRQTIVEAAAGPGTSLLELTEPTETATAAAFGHTAVLAGRPANQAALTEVGRLFGRIAHLIDAVEDLTDDLARGKWNPLAATETEVEQAHRLCTDALLGIELALADVEFTDSKLVHKLLTHELRHAVRRTFGHTGRSCRTGATVVNSRRRGYPPPGYDYPPQGYGYPQPGYGPPPGYYGPPPRRRGFCGPVCEAVACCECCRCGEDCFCCGCEACECAECCGDSCCDCN
jgi:hypothetical protein